MNPTVSVSPDGKTVTAKLESESAVYDLFEEHAHGDGHHVIVLEHGQVEVTSLFDVEKLPDDIFVEFHPAYRPGRKAGRSAGVVTRSHYRRRP